MENILLTGASGFIGKRMLDFLKEEKDYNVVLLTSKKIQGYTCVEHRNYQYTKKDFRKAGVDRVDIVIHLGAFAPSKREQMDDIHKTASNIVNTEHLLNQLPNIPRRFILCSTIAIYGENYGENVDESHTIEPGTLYGMSKLFCERMVSQWGVKNHVEVEIARFGTIYGPGEGTDRDYLIPHLIKKAIRNEKIIIFSDGSERRAYLYIDDLCRYLCKLALHTNATGIINLVSSHPVTICDILAAIQKISEKQLEVGYHNEKPKYGNESYDTSKLDKVLGIRETTLEYGLTEVYKYWRKSCEV